ncbi:MAG: hypothetical protein PHP99_04605 [Paludibacter sp.]|nr:hypothetical protein [Paludibacter sp.]
MNKTNITISFIASALLSLILWTLGQQMINKNGEIISITSWLIEDNNRFPVYERKTPAQGRKNISGYNFLPTYSYNRSPIQSQNNAPSDSPAFDSQYYYSSMLPSANDKASNVNGIQMLVLNSNLPSQRRSSPTVSGGTNMSMNMKSRFGANLSSDYSRPFAANEEFGSTLPPPDNGDGSEENLQPIPVGDGSVVFAVLIGFYAAFIELRRRKG